MNLFRLLFCCCLFSLPVSGTIAQTIDWSRRAGGTNIDEGRGIATDAAGYSYVTGYFRNTASFNSTSGSLSLTSDGDDDIFIAKYTPQGRLVWVRRAGSTGIDRGNAIALDNAGNFVITGSFQGTANFQNSAITVSSAGGSDILVAKYDTTGALVWARSAGGSSSDRGNGISTDGSNNVYITGEFQGTASFSGTPVSSAFGTPDIFVARYLANGTFSWVQNFGAAGNDRGLGISQTATGNGFITGTFESTVSFGNTTLSADGTGSDAFVAQYQSTDGAILWATRIGGSNANDQGIAIDTDATGNPYITGYFQGGATFGDPNSPPLLIASGSNDQDVFIARYTEFGVLQWAARGSSPGIDNGRGISVDPAGNALVTGHFNGNLTFFGTTSASVTLNSTDIQAFVVKYNASGAVVEALQAGGSGSELGYSISSDQNGNGYFTGTFSGATSTFGNSSLATAGLDDIFVARFVPSVPVLPVELISFKAIAKTNKVLLHWQTATEENNAYFTVERSADGIKFEPVLNVQGAGNSSGILSYSSEDRSPLPGTSFYRLRQTDLDSTFAFSPVVAIAFGLKEQPTLSELHLYPNPAEGTVFLEFNAAEAKPIQLTITDALGRQVYYSAPERKAGKHRIILQLHHLNAGIYMLQLQTNNQVHTKKIVLN